MSFIEYKKKWSDVLKNIKKSKKKNFLEFHEEYNQKGILELEDKFLNNDWYIYNEKIDNLSVRKIYYYKHMFLTNLIIEKISNYSEIIELGSGWGSRILFIKEILNKHYFSGEPNEYGRKCQEELIKKYNFKNVKVFDFDFTNFVNKKFRYSLKNPVFLTFNSIEQISKIDKNFYKNLKKYFGLRKLDIIHVEPVGYQFKPKDKWDKADREYNIKNNYNLNLANVIYKSKFKKMDIKKNILTCRSSKKTIFSPMSVIELSF